MKLPFLMSIGIECKTILILILFFFQLAFFVVKYELIYGLFLIKKNCYENTIYNYISTE